MSDFLKKNWGWFVLAFFLAFLIYTLFHKSPEIDFSKDKKTVDSLTNLLKKQDQKRIQDSIQFVIFIDRLDARNDSFVVINTWLKDEKKALKDEISKLTEPDTSLTMCLISKSKIIEQRDSAISIADKYEKLYEDQSSFMKESFKELQRQKNVSDSLFKWSTNSALVISSKYDSLYNSNLDTQRKLRTTRIEVKIGAGLLIVAAGVIFGLTLR